MLMGKVLTGSNVSTGFIYKPSYESSPLSCNDLDLGTSGTFNAGDPFYRNVSLQPNTTYYYRACGSDKTRKSSGSILSFRTKSIPLIACGSPHADSGGFEGLYVDYNMGSKGGHVTVEFEAFSIPDKLEIWHGGSRIYTTGGYVSGLKTVKICHRASRGPTWNVKVTGNSNTATKWNLKISCPETTSVFDLCY